MSFNSYEELMQVVEERRQETLTLETDLGTRYSPEYEDAKEALEKAEAMKLVMGEQQFLSDNLDHLKAEVERLRPPSRSIFIRYRKLELASWAALIKKQGLSAIDQYETVLVETFVGLWGTDPSKPEDWDEQHPDEEWVEPAPLTTDAITVSTKGGPRAVLQGAQLNEIVQTFIGWQNSSGDVVIRPTKSGLV